MHLQHPILESALCMRSASQEQLGCDHLQPSQLPHQFTDNLTCPHTAAMQTQQPFSRQSMQVLLRGCRVNGIHVEVLVLTCGWHALRIQHANGLCAL